MRQNPPEQDLDLDLAIGETAFEHAVVIERLTRLPDVDDWIAPSSLLQVPDDEKCWRILRQVVGANDEKQVVKVSDLARFERQDRAGHQDLNALIDIMGVLLDEVGGQNEKLIPADLHTLETARERATETTRSESDENFVIDSFTYSRKREAAWAVTTLSSKSVRFSSCMYINTC